MSKTPREVAHALAGPLWGALPGRCTDEDEPDDVHGMGCDALTSVIRARDAEHAAELERVRLAVLEEAAAFVFGCEEPNLTYIANGIRALGGKTR